MRRRWLGVLGPAVVVAACATSAIGPGRAAGPIPADEGGAAGYQHGIERSRAAIGGGRRRVDEFGFAKIVGSDGTLAVDAANGAVVVIPNARTASTQAAVLYSGTPEAHNQQVLDYFVGAGIPAAQVGGVHATTSLAASGNEGEARAPRPTVVGYQSVLARQVDGIPVIDSVAWARMSERGDVISEFVYWPAIPARVIADAKRLREQLGRDQDRRTFLARLPAVLPAGHVVIRHSSATVAGPFEVFASYDVLERRGGPGPTAQGSVSAVARAATIVRHFDADGFERRLPQERRNVGSDFPGQKQPASAPGAR
jgi:hypothetical protein